MLYWDNPEKRYPLTAKLAKGYSRKEVWNDPENWLAELCRIDNNQIVSGFAGMCVCDKEALPAAR
jgi:hypothetical protein